MYWKKKGRERERGRVQGGEKKGTVQRYKEEDKWQGWERGSIKIWGRGKGNEKHRGCERREEGEGAGKGKEKRKGAEEREGRKVRGRERMGKGKRKVTRSDREDEGERKRII